MTTTRQCVKCGGSWAGPVAFDTLCRHDFGDPPEPLVIPWVIDADELGFRGESSGILGPVHPTRDGAIAAWKAEWRRRRDANRCATCGGNGCHLNAPKCVASGGCCEACDGTGTTLWSMALEGPDAIDIAKELERDILVAVAALDGTPEDYRSAVEKAGQALGPAALDEALGPSAGTYTVNYEPQRERVPIGVAVSDSPAGEGLVTINMNSRFVSSATHAEVGAEIAKACADKSGNGRRFARTKAPITYEGCKACLDAAPSHLDESGNLDDTKLDAIKEALGTISSGWTTVMGTPTSTFEDLRDRQDDAREAARELAEEPIPNGSLVAVRRFAEPRRSDDPGEERNGIVCGYEHARGVCGAYDVLFPGNIKAWVGRREVRLVTEPLPPFLGTTTIADGVTAGTISIVDVNTGAVRRANLPPPRPCPCGSIQRPQSFSWFDGTGSVRMWCGVCGRNETVAVAEEPLP